ncbi:MAG: hypothetical protein HC880_11605 [Bacteroidia bacterium]|nr:hypothetical protein [Bacteroidia bacterium]
MTFTTAVIVSVLCLLIAAILGGLIVYFIMDSRIRKLRDELLLLQEDHKRLRLECENKQQALTQQIQQKEEKRLETDRSWAGQKSDWDRASGELSARVAERDQHIESLRQEIALLNTESKNQEDVWKQQLAEQLKGLQVDLADVKAKTAALALRNDNEKSEKPQGIEKDLALAKIRERALSFDYSNMGVARADEKDDLKLINGIGPFIEEKLNALGIFTFEQIARFNENDIAQVTDAIEFFPGRIQRDQWIVQAKERVSQRISPERRGVS